jgi:diguanylate cyclase (GGDEF)-like protein
MNSYPFDISQSKILIVDDVPENLQLLSNTLNEQGYQVRRAKNGEIALMAAASMQPDLILLDIRMPDMDGYEVCRRLKASEQTWEIPVIFLSAMDDVRDKVQSFEVGGVDFITKPFQVAEVLARVKHQLSLQAAKAEINRLNTELELRVQQRTAQLAEVNQSLQQQIAEREQIEKQLLHGTLHDALTGLPNRSLFMDRVEFALKKVARYPNYLFAVLFLDCDRFKLVNDSLGHFVGDQLLVAIAKMLKNALRDTDTVARLGGDEFTILLDDVRDMEEVEKIAARIQLELSAPFVLEGNTIFTSVSIGIVLSSLEQSSALDLLRNADIAMYSAKEQGRSCYKIFDQTMYIQTIERLQIENDLRQALEQKEFLVYYQPIISLQTGKLSGFEALIRWQHPHRGLVSPLDFISIAEDTGLIVFMGEWVLHAACRQLKTWQQQFPTAGPLTIAVNLTSKEIREPGLIENIDRILAETGLEGHHLKIEITESMLVEHNQATINVLSQIRARKIQLSIDDFGQGYSSLGYLQRFPINTLKIDRSFVSDVNLECKNAELVRVIINLAHTLKMDVVAEGVETEAQLKHLQDLGCEFAQGYFFAQPLDCNAAMALIDADRQWLSLALSADPQIAANALEFV